MKYVKIFEDLPGMKKSGEERFLFSYQKLPSVNSIKISFFFIFI